MYKGLPPGIPDLIQVFVRKAQAFQIAPGRAELLPHKGSEAVHALHGSPEQSRVGVGIVLQEQPDLGAQIDVGEGIVGDNVGVLAPGQTQQQRRCDTGAVLAGSAVEQNAAR